MRRSGMMRALLIVAIGLIGLHGAAAQDFRATPYAPPRLETAAPAGILAGILCHSADFAEDAALGLEAET